MAKQGKRHVAAAPRNTSPTLGAYLANPAAARAGEAPIYAARCHTVRSLRCVGGTRPSCQHTKKRNARARRAGFPNFAAFADFAAKLATQKGPRGGAL